MYTILPTHRISLPERQAEQNVSLRSDIGGLVYIGTIFLLPELRTFPQANQLEKKLLAGNSF